MAQSISDIEFLKDTYALARNKYKPKKIKILLIGEAPPCNLDRYFYFEDVKVQDSLFLEIMGVLYGAQKKKYLASGRRTELKAELLQRFAEDGFWFLNVAELPFEVTAQSLEANLPDLLERLAKYIDATIPIIVIKTNVFDLVYPMLERRGYNVINARLPFPGSGQQRVFREGFKQAVDELM